MYTFFGKKIQENPIDIKCVRKYENIKKGINFPYDETSTNIYTTHIRVCIGNGCGRMNYFKMFFFINTEKILC